MSLTLAHLRLEASMRGMTVRKSDGEYRVAYKGANAEASAYYTTDIGDALATMCHMYSHNITAGR